MSKVPLRVTVEKVFEKLPGVQAGNSRTSKQRCLLRLLATAHQQQLSPAILTKNLAEEYPGSYGHKLQQLHRWLKADGSMSAAVRHTPGILSESDTLAVLCGIETQNIEPTFKILTDSNRDDAGNGAQAPVTSKVGYFVFLSCTISIALAFSMSLVLPMIAYMFEEFGLEMGFGLESLHAYHVLVGIALLFFILATIAVALLQIPDIKRFMTQSFFSDWLPSIRSNRQAGIARIVSVPLSQNQPLRPTLLAAAQFHVSAKWRKKLLHVATQLEDNADFWSLANQQGILQPSISKQMRSMQTAQTQSWTLQTLANQLEIETDRSAIGFINGVFNLPTIILGFVAGWLILGVMSSLTNLIISLN